MAKRDRKQSHPGSRIYRQPVLIVYRKDGVFFAQLAHPIHEVPKNAVKTAKEGVNTVIGKWRDIGYSFGTNRESIPEYVKLPEGAEYLLCKTITHVPLTT